MTAASPRPPVAGVTAHVGRVPRQASRSTAWQVRRFHLPRRLKARCPSHPEFRRRGIPFRARRKLAAANPAVLLAELGELVRATIERSPGSTVQDRISAAARSLRLPRSRVQDWWYREVRRVEAWEDHTIRRYAMAARESEIRRMERQLEALRAELAQMADPPGLRPALAAPLRARRPARRSGAGRA